MAQLQSTNALDFWLRGQPIDLTGKASTAAFDFWLRGRPLLTMDAPTLSVVQPPPAAAPPPAPAAPAASITYADPVTLVGDCSMALRGGSGGDSFTSQGQAVAQFVSAGDLLRVNLSGAFVGTLTFSFSTDGGKTWTLASLLNMGTGAMDQNAAGPGSWLYFPLAGGDGVLRVFALSWTSGSAQMALLNLAQSPQQIDLALLPSALRTTSSYGPVIKNGGWRGLALFLNLIAVTGASTGITPTLRVVDPTSGQSTSAPIGTACLTPGFYGGGLVYPASSLASWSMGSVVSPVPTEFQLGLSHGDAGQYTYSLAASLLL
jgi:hypothetical protein